MAKVGRPSSFKPEFVEQAAKLCALGATDNEMAEFFGVTEKTLNNWKAEYPEFLQSLKLAKDAADDRVEKSLYRRALGYSHPAVKIFQYEGAAVEVPYTEHYPPDTTAAIFWLKNRRRQDWRDVHQVEGSALGPFIGIKIVTGSDEKPIVEVTSEAADPAKLNGRTKP